MVGRSPSPRSSEDKRKAANTADLCETFLKEPRSSLVRGELITQRTKTGIAADHGSWPSMVV